MFFEILTKFGLPVAAAVMGIFIYIILKYILESVISQVKGIHGIIMGLDNRIKTMNHDMVKLDILISHALKLKPDMDRDAFRDMWIDGFKQIAPLTDDAGLILTIENFPGKLSAFVTAEDYYKAKAEIPQLKLTFDDGNAAFGEDPVESFKQCVDDVVHAHFKDWYIVDQPRKGYRDSLIGKYFKPALISQGDIDTAAVWKTMKSCGYKGFINIEYEDNTVKADKAIQIAADYLRGI